MPDVYTLPNVAFQNEKIKYRNWGTVYGNEFELTKEKNEINKSLVFIIDASDPLSLDFYGSCQDIDIYYKKSTERDIKKLCKHLNIEIPEAPTAPTNPEPPTSVAKEAPVKEGKASPLKEELVTSKEEDDFSISGNNQNNSDEILSNRSGRISNQFE
ncbi:MAG: hypothetical protein HRT71_09565 [Flavobacteriales bacterium]|nr:hypothetical protein [Flavobacteriales bacterium]